MTAAQLDLFAEASTAETRRDATRARREAVYRLLDVSGQTLSAYWKHGGRHTPQYLALEPELVRARAALCVASDAEEAAGVASWGDAE